MIHCPGMVNKKQEYFTVEDLILGQTIDVYNRKFLLLDCDNFTREYYRENYGIE